VLIAALLFLAAPESQIRAVPVSPALEEPIESVPARPLPIGLLIGVKAGPVVGATFRLGGSISLELGYRLPFASRIFGVSIEAGYMESVVTTSLLATCNVEIGLGMVRVLAGPTMLWTRGVGFNAALAFLFRLPFGALGLELRGVMLQGFGLQLVYVASI
jgi:hypothetical protein